MKFTAAQIRQMRYELEHPEQLKKRIEQENALIAATKAMFKEQGRNFDKEFEAWQKKTK